MNNKPFYFIPNFSVCVKCFLTTVSFPVSHNLQPSSLVQRVRYIYQSQATPISYTFLVADYWSSTATLSYKPLWQFGEVRTLLLPCYTAAHPTHPQRFLLQQRFFRRPTNVSQRHHHVLSIINHSVHNNPGSLSYIADNCYLSASLYMHFLIRPGLCL